MRMQAKPRGAVVRRIPINKEKRGNAPTLRAADVAEHIAAEVHIWPLIARDWDLSLMHFAFDRLHVHRCHASTQL